MSWLPGTEGKVYDRNLQSTYCRESAFFSAVHGRFELPYHLSRRILVGRAGHTHATGPEPGHAGGERGRSTTEPGGARGGATGTGRGRAGRGGQPLAHDVQLQASKAS